MIQSKLRWYHGLLAIALFGAVMALEYFGLLGKHAYATVIGEGLIALVAIGVVLIARENLSAVFTFKKVRWVQIAGLYLMWRGVLSAEMVLSEVLMHFFPRLMRETSGIEEWMHRVPFALAFFVIAVIPAVCEEMLFRGTLRYCSSEFDQAGLRITPWHPLCLCRLSERQPCLLHDTALSEQRLGSDLQLCALRIESVGRL